MEELIKRLERVIQTGVPDKDGMHPISAETVLEVVKAQLSKNLAEVGTDCISRQAAIDALKGCYCGGEDSCGEPWIYESHAVKAIEKLPTIQPEPHWIPVEQALPENNDPVNVTWVNHNPEVYYMDIKGKPFTATAHYHREHWYWYSSVTQDYLDEYGEWTPDLVDKDVEIIAWMPLPEPYKGVTE